MSPDVIALVALIAAFASFGQTVAGFGFSLLAVAPLGLLIDPKEAVATSSILLVTSCALLVWNDRRHIEWGATTSLLIGAIPGLPIGVVVLSVISERGLRIALGLAVFVAVGVMMRGFVLERPNRAFDLAGGFACGVLTTSVNTNGPPVVIVLQTRGMSPARFRPTTSAVLGINSAVGAVLFAIAGRMKGDALPAALVALPAVVVGWRVGLVLRERVPADRFRALIMMLLVIAATMTLVAAFS